MDYKKIISVTGMVGLYELVGSKKDGAIVRGLEDKVTRFVSQRIHQYTQLEGIEVYTSRDNVNLVDVFIAMQNSSEPLPSEKDGAAVKAYYEKVYPEMDFDRVYASDMKKMVKWYGILKGADVEIKPLEDEQTNEAESNEDATQTTEEVKPEEAEKKPKAKAAKHKAESDEVAEEKKPVAKKAAPKKKTE